MRLAARRAPILLVGLVSMACGMWLGLVRLGWNLPLPWQDQLIAHGPRPTRTVRSAFVLAMVTILAGVAAATCGRSLASARSAWGSLR